MPRQDVPYGGALCRIRERIGELFDLLGQKLHSINGVEGDGQGNITVVSGDPAVVINNDQAQHEIEIALDSSQLPAAAVSSVNGQTGTVALTADDIPSDNGDVQTDLDNLEAADTTLQGNINAEALARQNADSTLQTNINTVTASLPAAAAAAVAADPTVAQLVTDMAGKVDLTDVSTVETPDTIAKRNGSGRLVAADPASGATDKTLTTANWISQTGDSGPNNLIHKTGNETKSGKLTMSGNVEFNLRTELKSSNPYLRFCDTGLPARGQTVTSTRTSKILYHNITNDSLIEKQFVATPSGQTIARTQVINQNHTYYANFDMEVTNTGTTYLVIKIFDANGVQKAIQIVATLTP